MLGGACGLVGHYEAEDAAAGVALLREAQQLLVRAGVSRVVGPVNGSTWARYTNIDLQVGVTNPRHIVTASNDPARPVIK